MKDAFYFPHDCNAHEDPKLAALISKLGWAGYGLFWSIVELMHNQTGGRFEKFPLLYAGIGRALSTDEAQVKQLISASISEFFLFQENETHIWSNRVLRNMDDRAEKRLKKAEAGRLGGIRSGIKRSKTKQNEALLEANEPKERKGKESKEEEGAVAPVSFPSKDKELPTVAELKAAGVL